MQYFCLSKKYFVYSYLMYILNTCAARYLDITNISYLNEVYRLYLPCIQYSLVWNDGKSVPQWPCNICLILTMSINFKHKWYHFSQTGPDLIDVLRQNLLTLPGFFLHGIYLILCQNHDQLGDGRWKMCEQELEFFKNLY